MTKNNILLIDFMLVEIGSSANTRFVDLSLKCKIFNLSTYNNSETS